MPPIAIAAGIAAAGSIAGGVIGRSGANAQADAATQATQASVAEQRRQYDLSRADLAPWRTAGGSAVGRLAYLLGLAPGVPGVAGSAPATGGTPRPVPSFDPRGFDDALGGPRGGPRVPRPILDGERPAMTVLPPSAAGAGAAQPGAGDPDFGSLMRDFGLADFEKEPGYEFRISEGQKTLERSAAARGTLFSGGTLKALDRYNQDFASNEFGNAYNRFQNNRTTRYNFLSQLAGSGSTSANTLAGIGANTSANIGNTLYRGATDAAASRAAGNAALGQGIIGAGNNALNWYLASQQQQQAPPPRNYWVT